MDGWMDSTSKPRYFPLNFAHYAKTIPLVCTQYTAIPPYYFYEWMDGCLDGRMDK